MCDNPLNVPKELEQDAEQTLPGADFADRFVARCGDEDAPTLARRAFARAPRWVGGLMLLRDAAVSPWSLRTRSESLSELASGATDWFPVLSKTAKRVVYGIDDRHLDFRLVIDIEEGGTGSTNSRRRRPGNRVAATTFVRTHNAGGRLYLATILPFHKLIVATMLRRAVV